MTVSTEVARRVEYAGNGSTTVFAYSFPVYVDADLIVTQVNDSDGSGDTQTITTEYTVSGAGDASGGNVTMVTAPASGITLVISSSLPVKQTVDLVENSVFSAETLEDALDRLTLQTQEVKDAISRSITLPTTATGSVSVELPNPSASRVIAWSSDATALENGSILGTFRGNWATARAYNTRDIVKDSTNDNIYIVLGDYTSGANVAADVSSSDIELVIDSAASSTSASSAATSATNAATSATAAQSSEDHAASHLGLTNADVVLTHADVALTGADVTSAETAKTAAEAALDTFDDRFLGTFTTSAQPTVDNDGNTLVDGAIYFDTTLNTMMVYDLGNTTWLRISPNSADMTNITTVSGISGNVTTVAGISGNVTTVAGISANTTTVAGISANVLTVAGIAANVATVAGDSADIATVAADGADIGVVAADGADIGVVSGISANVSTVAGISSNTTTVAGISANVSTVAGISADVTAAATNSADITNFADVYVGASSSAPTTRTDGSALQTGDLYFNTTTDIMNVRNSSAAWESAAPGVGNFYTKVAADAKYALLGANSDITSITGLTTDLSVAQGGTGASTVSAARASLGITDHPGKNLLRNGQMSVSQRGASFAATANGAYTLDGWAYTGVDSSVITITQDSSGVFAAWGHDYALKVDITTTEGSPGSGEASWVEQRVEAQDLQVTRWGTSAAKDLTLSFLYQSPKSGTHSVAFRHNHYSGGARVYPIEFTVASANTPELINVTIPGLTSQAFANDTSSGFIVRFPITAGSNYQSTADTWTVGNQCASTNQQNLADSTANNIYIGAVQLEIGDTATYFEHDPISVTLAKCQRYYRRWYGIGGSMSIQGHGNLTSRVYGGFGWSQPMRAKPTMSTDVGGNATVTARNTTIPTNTTTFWGSALNWCSWSANLNSPYMTAGEGCSLYFPVDYYFDASAEL